MMENQYDEVIHLLEQILNYFKITRLEDELITLEEAERITGMEYQTLRQMFLDGKLQGKRFGRSIRLSKLHLLQCEK